MHNSVKNKMLLFALESGSSLKCLAEILLAVFKASPSSVTDSQVKAGHLNAGEVKCFNC